MLMLAEFPAPTNMLDVTLKMWGEIGSVLTDHADYSETFEPKIVLRLEMQLRCLAEKKYVF